MTDIIDQVSLGLQNILKQSRIQQVTRIVFLPMWKSILIMLAISSAPIVVPSLVVAGMMKLDVLEDIPPQLLIMMLPILPVAEDLFQCEKIIRMLMPFGSGGQVYIQS